MPVQQQMSSFAKRLGGMMAEVNAEFAGKPVDLAGKRLPAGIKEGVARLSTMYTKQSEKDDGVCPKGETFFRASAIVISPADYAGAVTQFVVPLCNVPAKGQSKGKSFRENWNKFRSLFEALGIAPFPEPPIDFKVDQAGSLAQGSRIEAYFFAAMRMLTDPVRMKTNPIFISFSTRGWTPPKTIAKPDPTEMVFEDWHGLAKSPPPVNPAAGVTESPANVQPGPMSPPPSPNGQPQQPSQTQPTDPAADYADTVAALVEVAMNDPEGATDDGAAASTQLETMAWAAGWTKDQTKNATDWAQVGDMALNAPTAGPTGATGTVGNTGTIDPIVGSKWMYAKRSKDGAKLMDKNGKEFPAQEVEVVTMDTAAETCKVKTVKDGKDVVDIRTKKPVAVKFDWLENAPPY